MEEEYSNGWVSVSPVYRGPEGEEIRAHPPVRFTLRHLERIPSGVSYPEIVSRVEVLHGKLGSPTTILDATGVGKAAIELFRRTDIPVLVFTLVAGDQVALASGSRRSWPAWGDGAPPDPSTSALPSREFGRS